MANDNYIFRSNISVRNLGVPLTEDVPFILEIFRLFEANLYFDRNLPILVNKHGVVNISYGL